MRTEEFDFELPPELVAQEPIADRAASRLLHYRRSDRSISHRHFSELSEVLRQGDLLVLNDTKVIPARFTLRKESGGIVQGLFLEESQPGTWHVLLQNVGKSPVGTRFHFEAEPQLSA